MKKYWNSAEGLFHNFKFFFLSSQLGSNSFKLLVLSSVLSVILIVGWVLYPRLANSGPYLEYSAHGNSSYGVLRTSLSTAPNNYARGNCAHCHEQHASIEGVEPAPDSPPGPDFYLLFQDLWTGPIQSNVFCYGCHVETASYQLGGHIYNYSYSYKRGGDTDTCPDSIFKAFQFVQNNGQPQANCTSNTPSNVGSAHTFIDFTPLVGNWGFSTDQNAVNPCSACHNPHKAQKDFPCSRPSAHTNIYAWDVWGDNTEEKMNYYTLNYWAPKRVGVGYEPDGSTTTRDGSNLPDYVSLCTDCHNSTRFIYSTRLSRDLYRIDWGGFGDFHGGRPRIDNGGDFSGVGEYGDLLEPYKEGVSYFKTNYVLSCTDCHEPHGSPNEFLLRKTVNGTQVPIISSSKLWYNWCQACHSINGHDPDVDPTLNCFGGPSGGCHRHCDGSTCSSSSKF